MADIKVTVLMAVYNGGDYLKIAVDSVLKQDFSDFEILIIDDCSNDGAINEIANRRDPRIRIFRNPSNIGQTASLNVGLAMAKGDIVARMDADDMAYPQWLSKGYAYLGDHPDVDVVGCQAVVMDQHGRIFKKLYCPSTSKDMVLRCLFASPLNHVGVLMRRVSIIQYGGYDPRYRIAADFALWSVLLRAGCVLGVIRNIGVAIRSHVISVTAANKGRADVPEVCQIMQENIHFFCRLNLTAEQSQLWWLAAYMPEELPVQQYEHVLNLMEQLYLEFKCEQIGMLEGQRKVFYRRQARILFVKVCLGRAAKRYIDDLVFITRSAVKHFGWCSFYGLWAVFSVEGRIVGLVQKVFNAYQYGRGFLNKLKGQYGW